MSTRPPPLASPGHQNPSALPPSSVGSAATRISMASPPPAADADGMRMDRERGMSSMSISDFVGDMKADPGMGVPGSQAEVPKEFSVNTRDSTVSLRDNISDDRENELRRVRDELSEREAELRQVKMDAAMTAYHGDELQTENNMLKKQLLMAISQISLIQQALETKLLRKSVSRSMAITSGNKAKRSAADALSTRNKAVFTMLTHAMAGESCHIDLERYDLTVDQMAALDAAEAQRRPPRKMTFRNVQHWLLPSDNHDNSGNNSSFTGPVQSDDEDEDDEDDSEEEDDEGSQKLRHRSSFTSTEERRGEERRGEEKTGGKRRGEERKREARRGEGRRGEERRGLRRMVKRMAKGTRGDLERDARATVLSNAPLITQVLSFLTHAEIGKASCVSRLWRSVPLRSDLLLWRLRARVGAVSVSCRPQLWRATSSCAGTAPPHALTLKRLLLALEASKATGLKCSALSDIASREVPVILSSLRTIIRNGELGLHEQAHCPIVWSTSLFARLAAWLAFPAISNNTAEVAAHDVVFDAAGLKHRGVYLAALHQFKDEYANVDLDKQSGPALHARNASLAQVYCDTDESDDDTPHTPATASRNIGAPTLSPTDARMWLGRRRLRARTLLKLYGHSASAGSCIVSAVHDGQLIGKAGAVEEMIAAEIGSAASENQRTSTDYVFPPRPLSDRTFAMHAVPRPCAVSFEPCTADERAAFDSQFAAEATPTAENGPEAMKRQRDSKLAQASLSSQVFSAYTAAARTNQKAADLAARIKASCSAAKQARASVNTHLNTIKEMAMNDVPLEADISTQYALAGEAAFSAEKTIHELIPAYMDAVAAAYVAVNNADRVLVETVIESRRAHATQLCAAWYGSHASPDAAHIHPSTGTVVPSCGITTTAHNMSSADRALIHGAVCQLSVDMNKLQESLQEKPCADTSLLPYYIDMPPLPALPLRLQRFIITASCEDADPVEEAMLGLEHVPVPGVIAGTSKAGEDAAKTIEFDLGPPAEGVSILAPSWYRPVEVTDPGLERALNQCQVRWPQQSHPPQWSKVILPDTPFTSQHLLIDADVRRTFGEFDAALKIFGWQKAGAPTSSSTSGLATPWSRNSAATPSGDSDGVPETERHMARLSSLLHGHPSFSSSDFLFSPATTRRILAQRPQWEAGGEEEDGAPEDSHKLSITIEDFGKLGASEHRLDELEKLVNLLPYSFFGKPAEESQALHPGHLAVLRHRLRKVLLAHSAFDRDVGYCQGQNFMTSILLLHMDANSSFWVLQNLMNGNRFRYREIFATGLKRVAASFHTLTALLQKHIPQLARHFAAEKVIPDMYAAGWVMTLFSSLETLPLTYVVPMWDIFFVDGWKFLFRVIIALMDEISQDLRLGDFPTIVQFLHKLPVHRLPPSSAALIRRAINVKITTRMLNDIERKYEAAQPKEFVGVVEVAPGDAHGNDSVQADDDLPEPADSAATLAPLADPQSSVIVVEASCEVPRSTSSPPTVSRPTVAPKSGPFMHNPYLSDDDDDRDSDAEIAPKLQPRSLAARSASQTAYDDMPYGVNEGGVRDSPISQSSAISDTEVEAALQGSQHDVLLRTPAMAIAESLKAAANARNHTPSGDYATDGEPVVASAVQPALDGFVDYSLYSYGDDFDDLGVQSSMLKTGKSTFSAANPFEFHASASSHSKITPKAADSAKKGEDMRGEGCVVSGKPTSSAAGTRVSATAYAAALYGDDPLA